MDYARRLPIPPRDRLVQKDPCRVHIAARRHLGALGLLGAPVAGRADLFPGIGAGLAGLTRRLHDAEIGENGPAVLEENVAGLHVAVDDAAAVRIGEGVEEILGEAPHFRQGESDVRDPVPDRLALEEGHHEEVDPVPGVVVVDRDDVGVAVVGEGAGLEAKALHGRRSRMLWAQRLHRNRAIEPRVVCPVHDTHAAAPDLLTDQVAWPDRFLQALFKGRHPRPLVGQTSRTLLRLSNPFL